MSKTSTDKKVKTKSPTSVGRWLLDLSAHLFDEESFTIHGNLWQDLQLIAHHVPIKSKSLICKLLLQISSVSPNNVSCWLSIIGKSYEMSYVFLPSFSEALIDLNATHCMESQECQPYWVKPFKEDHGLPPKSEKASFTSWRASFELAVEKALASNMVRRRQAEREVLCQWWGGGAEHTVMSELSPPILMHACPPERVPPFLSSKGGRTTSGTRHARLCQHAAAGTHDINMHGAKKFGGDRRRNVTFPFSAIHSSNHSFSIALPAAIDGSSWNRRDSHVDASYGWAQDLLKSKRSILYT